MTLFIKPQIFKLEFKIMKTCILHIVGPFKTLFEDITFYGKVACWVHS